MHGRNLIAGIVEAERCEAREVGRRQAGRKAGTHEIARQASRQAGKQTGQQAVRTARSQASACVCMHAHRQGGGDLLTSHPERSGR